MYNNKLHVKVDFFKQLRRESAIMYGHQDVNDHVNLIAKFMFPLTGERCQ